MEQLREKILREGVVKSDDILLVDGFVNHQIDVGLFEQCGEEFRRRFAGVKIDRILTIEASGIGIACIPARHFGVPVVYAKKSLSKILGGDVYDVKVPSFTKNIVYDVIVSKNYLHAGENVLIVDDILAQGNALMGLIEIVRSAGATVAGCGILIEKSFQNGGARVRALDVRVDSLAIIDSLAG